MTPKRWKEQQIRHARNLDLNDKAVRLAVGASMTQSFTWMLGGYPEEKPRAIMAKEMGRMWEVEKEDNVPTSEVTQTVSKISAHGVGQALESFDRLFVRGCPQHMNELDKLCASTPVLAVPKEVPVVMGIGPPLLRHHGGSTPSPNPTSHPSSCAPHKEFFPRQDMMWIINRNVYGLRDAPRVWQKPPRTGNGEIPLQTFEDQWKRRRS